MLERTLTWEQAKNLLATGRITMFEFAPPHTYHNYFVLVDGEIQNWFHGAFNGPGTTKENDQFFRGGDYRLRAVDKPTHMKYDSKYA